MQSLDVDRLKKKLNSRRKIIPGPEATPCWIWQGAKIPQGYGSIRVHGKHFTVHALSYQLYYNLLPPTRESRWHLDHLCSVRACFNPEHLEAVPAAVNMSRGHNHNAEKTHCLRGHPYNDKNTLYRTDKGGLGRECRKCALIRGLKWQVINRTRYLSFRKLRYERSRIISGKTYHARPRVSSN